MLQQHREEYTVDKNRTDIDYLKKIQQILSKVIRMQGHSDNNTTDKCVKTKHLQR